MAKDNEQHYVFVDKSGHCFDDFQRMGGNNGGLAYNNMVGFMFKNGREFIVGDMLAFRDDLLNAGFKWAEDFYVKKV